MPQVKRSRSRTGLPTIHPAAAAIDIGATIHVAAVGPDRDTDPVRTFQTFTDDLHRLADWFDRCGIKTVAMESTGGYWIPVFEILEQRGFAVMVVNPSSGIPAAARPEPWPASPATPSTCRGAKLMSATLNGCNVCSNTACFGPASGLRPKSPGY